MKRVGNDHVLAGAGHPRHAGMRLGVGRTQTSRQHDQWHVAEQTGILPSRGALAPASIITVGEPLPLQ